MKHRTYLFEAKGIQRWILEGGRLRDIATASDILARSFRSDMKDLLRDVLAAADFQCAFSRRAGGAFMLHYLETEKVKFDQFRALWRMVFMQALAGLEFVEAFGAGATATEARQNAYSPEQQLRSRAGRENGAADIPPFGHALVAFSPRTGRPAVPFWGSETVDAVIASKRLQADRGSALGLIFTGGDESAKWPNYMDDDPKDAGADAVLFPFTGDDRWIAVMHADISALGRFYAAVTAASDNSSEGIKMARAAASAIENAVAAAARHATEIVLRPKAGNGAMPARPIVLGGDDITIILRGDVALPFARAFLEHLEIVSQAELGAFAAKYKIADPGIMGPLTAAAGVAFGKAKQPFFRLLELAEGLCKHAKLEAKSAGRTIPPSVISFLRVTESALATDANGMFKRLDVAKGVNRLHAQPYHVGEIAAPGFIKLADLDSLRAQLQNPGLKSGSLREVRSMWMQGFDAMATDTWRRWMQIAKRRDAKSFQAFLDQLAILVGGTAGPEMAVFAPSSTSFGPTAGGTPMFDALEWNAIAEAEV